MTRPFASAKLAALQEDETMQYLLIIYGDEALRDQAVMQEITAAHMRLGAELQESGAMVGGNRLRSSDTATTVRTTGGVQSLHDGPYAETREQLGGYYLVEAPDLDAAVGWAKKIPGGPNYAVEVRPIWPLGEA
ncbi:YciI family protein [Phenylobacterium sp.]|uniref:YciI family protein n=1 Tax=Phenylobacterium sp. TaxID=1871053 RepID=UPI002E353F8A|nr:YciI family protein [Phenylobacterium sp.]HEX3366765.1 YciI family protein [Phenylobacterium sp.]